MPAGSASEQVSGLCERLRAAVSDRSADLAPPFLDAGRALAGLKRSERAVLVDCAWELLQLRAGELAAALLREDRSGGALFAVLHAVLEDHGAESAPGVRAVLDRLRGGAAGDEVVHFGEQRDGLYHNAQTLGYFVGILEAALARLGKQDALAAHELGRRLELKRSGYPHGTDGAPYEGAAENEYEQLRLEMRQKLDEK